VLDWVVLKWLEKAEREVCKAFGRFVGLESPDRELQDYAAKRLIKSGSRVQEFGALGVLV